MSSQGAHNQCIQRTPKSVTSFACAKAAPLLVAADASVSHGRIPAFELYKNI